jgi:signal peptidase II
VEALFHKLEGLMPGDFLVLAGAVGNLIDRALLGYVTDMFETLFMRFAVFNVADICVVVGGIAFCVYYLFFHGKEEGHGADSVAG